MNYLEKPAFEIPINYKFVGGFSLIIDCVLSKVCLINRTLLLLDSWGFDDFPDETFINKVIESIKIERGLKLM